MTAAGAAYFWANRAWAQSATLRRAAMFDRGSYHAQSNWGGYRVGRQIAVFGTGYLGATHAACMAELGHEVLGVDVDESKLAKLAGGELPFYEPGLPDVLRRNIDAGRLRFTTSYQEAADFADTHFIAVGTPQKQGELA